MRRKEILPFAIQTELEDIFILFFIIIIIFGGGWGGRWERGSGWGTHANPWPIHVNAWQKSPQYCKN